MEQILKSSIPISCGIQKISTCVYIIIGLISLGLSVLLAMKYSVQPILDYPFRQSQAALTSYWLSKTGFKFAYETPVLGYPWSIPFEFPFFQYLVAKLSCWFNLDLQQTGRLTSYFFLLACIIPIIGVFKKLFLSSWVIPFWIFVTLFFSSPLYLYWGRSFMIETTGLFFTLCFLNCSISLIKGNFSWRNIGLIGFFLLVAILQKITTIIPLFLVICILIGISGLKMKNISFSFSAICKLTIAFLVPLTIGYLWVHYTDLIKDAYPIGTLLDSKYLRGWNYGTLNMRFSKAFWVDVIWSRAVYHTISSGHFVSFILLFGFIYSQSRERKLIILSLMIFLSYFMIFTNVHFVHDYYQVANGIFLVAAVSFAFSGMFFKFSGKSTFILIPLIFLFFLNLYTYKHVFFNIESLNIDDNTNQTLAVAKYIRDNTPQNKPILVYGYDWSSDISFFSQRKSYTVPDWAPNILDTIKNPIRYLQEEPSSIIICNNPFSMSNTTFTELIDATTKFYRPLSTKVIQLCHVFLK